MTRTAIIVAYVMFVTSTTVADLPDELVSELRKNAERLSPVKATWTYRAKALVSEETLTSDYEVTHFSRFRANGETVAGVDGLRLLQKSKMPQTGDDGKIQFGFMEKTFDGEYWYSGTGVDNVKEIGANPVLAIERLTDARAKFKGKLFLFDYLELAGFGVAQTARELGTAPVSEILRHPRELLTVSSVSENGQELVKISALISDGTLEWWLVTDKGHAVLRSERRNANGQLIYKTENANFVQLAQRNVWLPKKSDRFWHQWGGKGPFVSEPVVVEQYRLTMLYSDPIAPEEFVLNYDDAPGTFMSNAKLADEMKSAESKLEYRVPAKQEDLDRVIEDAALGKNYRKPKPLLPRSIFVCAGVAAVVIISWLVMRRVR